MDSEYMPRKRRGKKRLRRGKTRYKGSALEKFNLARKRGRKRKARKSWKHLRSGYAFRPMSKRAATRHVNKVIRKAKKHRVRGHRLPGLSRAQMAVVRADQAKSDAEYKKFDAARSAIAKRLGVTSGHAKAHYQALIEYHGMSPEKAEEQTWGFQP